jgi:hypothetical protein
MNPELEAKALFADLQRKYPGRFGDNQLRTWQRRIKDFRATEGADKEVPGKPDQPIWPVLADVQLENPRQIAFLSSFEICCCVRSAARASGVTRQIHYTWLRSDSAYAVAFEQAKRVAGDLLESQVIERTVNGWLEPVYFEAR